MFRYLFPIRLSAHDARKMLFSLSEEIEKISILMESKCECGNCLPILSARAAHLRNVMDRIVPGHRFRIRAAGQVFHFKVRG